VFRRRRSPDGDPVEGDEALGQDSEVVEDGDLDDFEDADDDEVRAPEASLRAEGPWDSTEIETDDSYLDLGAMRIAPAEGMEVQLEVDPGTGAVVAVTLVDGESSLALQAFAAPRREGMWSDVRKEIAAGISASGGTVDFPEGAFGTELRSVMTVQTPEGRQGRAPVRFIGIDGPRWFLRAVLNGPAAADDVHAKALELVVRGVVVVRGTEAMAPGDPLVLAMPGEAGKSVAEAAGGSEPLQPFQRGPEITEIR